jgi:sensor histidine kinase regulating citrate/malate metabolism
VGDRYRKRVADDGPGLPEMEREVLGADTETPLRHGQGIGLCLVNAVVTEAGRTLEAAVDSVAAPG